MVGILTLIQLMPVETQPVVETLADAIISLLSELSGLGLNVLGYHQLSNIKENLTDLYVSLPLPEQEAPEVVKEVVDETSQKNYWSHTLFNSPVQRNVPKVQEKMPWHSMGLFGHGVKQLEYSSEPFVYVPAV